MFGGGSWVPCEPEKRPRCEGSPRARIASPRPAKRWDGPPSVTRAHLGPSTEFIPGVVETLGQYSRMEERLAELAPVRIYRALRESFGARFIKPNKLGGMGNVGAREGDFASMLGLTYEAAKADAAQLAAPGPSAGGAGVGAPLGRVDEDAELAERIERLALVGCAWRAR